VIKSRREEVSKEGGSVVGGRKCRRREEVSKEGGSVEGGRTCQVCDLSGRHLIGR
jgi:hypothetical protein